MIEHGADVNLPDKDGVTRSSTPGNAAISRLRGCWSRPEPLKLANKEADYGPKN
ncbi:MAG: hypothetical protein U0401_08405 [Anaerolineae bacterium]